MSQGYATPQAPGFVEDVEIQGHIIDSLILPKVLDEILTHGGSYVLKEIRVGQRQTDLSHARIEVRAPTAAILREILDSIHDHGAVSTSSQDCKVVAADMNSAFPEGFYSTTNHRTQIRLRGEWVDVEDQEMDCGILVDPEGGAARCIPMVEVREGDLIVVGRQGLRVFPGETSARQNLFEFMASPVSSGVVRSGIMYESVRHNIPFVLAGSIRDDGPLPEVITDVLVAQQRMRELIHGVGFCLMVATALHAIATGNLLPAWVKVACVDINPATVTKLMDRGSVQTVGIVTDAEPFLRALVHEVAST